MYTTHEVVEKYQSRMNKTDSQDYDNLWWYQIEESFYFPNMVIEESKLQLVSPHNVNMNDIKN